MSDNLQSETSAGVGLAPPVIPPPVIALQPPKPVPGILQSISLCALFYALCVPPGLLPVLGVHLGMFTALLIQQAIGWPVTIAITLYWVGKPWREACAVRPFPIRFLLALVPASFGVTILLLEVAGWIPMPEALQQFLTKQVEESSKLLLFIPVVLVAPIAEETFFRGLVLGGYLGRYSATKAVWVSALLFAAFHLNPWQAVIALPLGLAFAWLVLRTRSILPGMFAHAVVNFTTNFLLGPLGALLGYSAQELKDRPHFPLSMLSIGAATAVLGSLLLWRSVRAQDLPPQTIIALSDRS